MTHRVKLPALMAGLTLSALAVGRGATHGPGATPPFNQISRTIRALLGDTFGAKADADYELASSLSYFLFNRTGAGPIKGLWAKPA